MGQKWLAYRPSTKVLWILSSLSSADLSLPLYFLALVSLVNQSLSSSFLSLYAGSFSLPLLRLIRLFPLVLDWMDSLYFRQGGLVRSLVCLMKTLRFKKQVRKCDVSYQRTGIKLALCIGAEKEKKKRLQRQGGESKYSLSIHKGRKRTLFFWIGNEEMD